MTTRNFLTMFFSFCLAAASVAAGQEQPLTQTPTPTERSIERLRHDVNKLRIATDKARQQAEERIANQRAAEQAERQASEQRAAVIRKNAAEKAARESAAIQAQQRATMGTVLGTSFVLVILIGVVIVLQRSKERSKASRAAESPAPVEAPEPRMAIPPVPEVPFVMPQAVLLEEVLPVNPTIEELRELAARKGTNMIPFFIEPQEFPGTKINCMVELREGDHDHDLVHLPSLTKVVRWSERLRVIKKHLASVSTTEVNS